jgi:prepilin-type N-terminal cleavage/methylation domain-containing protein
MLLKLMKRKNSKGFSLIELIIVIVIIGILAAVVIPNMLGTTMQAHNATVDAMEGALKSSVELAYSGSLVSGENYYPHPTATEADHDGATAQFLTDYLLKAHDDESWTLEAVAGYDFDNADQDGGAAANPDAPAGNIIAVKWVYKVGTDNEQRIYYSAANGSGVVQAFGAKESNSNFYFARESFVVTALKPGGEPAAPVDPGVGAGFGDESDLRLKTDIVLTGHSPSGIPEYSFRYLSDPSGTIFHGTMAQDLLKTHPKAVLTGDNGFYKVYYNLIDVDFYALPRP